MENLKRLCDIPLRQTSVVEEIQCCDRLINRIYDMGITEGSEITPVFRAPFGDPTAYEIKHTLIALRKKDSREIWVRCQNEL
jgi:ferrous iron transport protein A